MEMHRLVISLPCSVHYLHLLMFHLSSIQHREIFLQLFAEFLLLTALVILNRQPFSLTFLLRGALPAQVPLALHKLPHSEVKTSHLLLSLISH